MTTIELIYDLETLELSRTTEEAIREQGINQALASLAVTAPEAYATWQAALQAQTEAARKFSAEEARLKAEIGGLVLAAQETAKGTTWRCEYAKPRVTWDSKLLEGIAKVYPAVAECRKTTEVGSIRFVRIK